MVSLRYKINNILIDVRKRARSSYGTARRTNKPSFAYSSYLIQRYESLSKYFKMTINELLSNKTEQAILSNELKSIIERLNLVKPKSQRSRDQNSCVNASNDSFIDKNPIPIISRLKKSRYNGIPRPARALTAKYRQGLPKPRPTSVSTNSSRLKYMPKSSQPVLKNSFISASNQNLSKPIVGLHLMTAGSTKCKFIKWV